MAGWEPDSDDHVLAADLTAEVSSRTARAGGWGWRR